MQSEDQVYFLINHKLTSAYVTHRHAKNLRHVSPQNRFTLKEFETTTREIGLIIFLKSMANNIAIKSMESVFRSLSIGH